MVKLSCKVNRVQRPFLYHLIIYLKKIEPSGKTAHVILCEWLYPESFHHELFDRQAADLLRRKDSWFNWNSKHCVHTSTTTNWSFIVLCVHLTVWHRTKFSSVTILLWDAWACHHITLEGRAAMLHGKWEMGCVGVTENRWKGVMRGKNNIMRAEIEMQ